MKSGLVHQEWPSDFAFIGYLAGLQAARCGMDEEQLAGRATQSKVHLVGAAAARKAKKMAVSVW